MRTILLPVKKLLEEAIALSTSNSHQSLVVKYKAKAAKVPATTTQKPTEQDPNPFNEIDRNHTLPKKYFRLPKVLEEESDDRRSETNK